MTPLGLMKALRDVPEDLIDIYTDSEWENPVCEEPAERTVQPIIVQHLPKAHFREEQVQCEAEDPSRKRNGSAIMSYLMTAGCTAACIAGFALMIRLFTEPVYPEQEISIPSETQNAAVTEITDLTTERTAAVTASQTNTETAAVNTATTAAVLQTDRTSATTAGLASGTTVHISGTGSRAVSGNAGRTETASAGRRRTGTTTTRATGTTSRTTRRTSATTTTRLTTTTTVTTTVTTEYVHPDAAGLFIKYAFEFPVYYRDGSYGRSLDYANSIYFDLEGNEIEYRDTNVRKADNPYRYREFNAEGECVTLGDYVYTCDYANGFYYAVLENGTAIIAGADCAWINGNQIETLVIPEEINGYRVTEIAQKAFQKIGLRCDSLREIVIADTVEIIHPYAFDDAFCHQWVDDMGATRIGSRRGCKINIPANVRIICRRAFANNYDSMGEEYNGDADNRFRARRMIELPETLEYVQNDAFGTSSVGDRYIFKMPKSLVLTDTTVIGGSETIEFSTLPQYTVGYWNTYYIDGEFNVVTFRDAIQYLQDMHLG